MKQQDHPAKIFILDTNVILHDSDCIYQFERHNIVIPISVIEELDRFKKGKNELNCNAREFLRTIDRLTGDHIFNGGVRISPDHGKISVVLEREFHEKIRTNFFQDKADNRILNTAMHIAENSRKQEVTLITKDVNLRMKAKSIGISAGDYATDHIPDADELYKGRSVLTDIDEGIIDQLYTPPYEISTEHLQLSQPLHTNEYVVMKNGSKSGIGFFQHNAGKIIRVESRSCFGIYPRNVEQTFAMDALLNRDIPLVTLTGKAGTGKTLLALAAALENRRSYRQIFISRPIVPLSNKDIGYLPGDIHSKLDPYMQPLYDNLMVIKNHCGVKNGKNNPIKDMLDEEKIVITPLSYIRGRSIVKVFFIVDEAQNLTPHEIKTIITRAGEGTKIVFTGDIFQIDHPYLDSRSNGLSYLIEKMKNKHLYTHINLERGERSELSEMASKLL